MKGALGVSYSFLKLMFSDLQFRIQNVGKVNQIYSLPVDGEIRDIPSSLSTSNDALFLILSIILW